MKYPSRVHVYDIQDTEKFIVGMIGYQKVHSK